MIRFSSPARVKVEEVLLAEQRAVRAYLAGFEDYTAGRIDYSALVALMDARNAAAVAVSAAFDVNPAVSAAFAAEGR